MEDDLPFVKHLVLRLTANRQGKSHIYPAQLASVNTVLTGQVIQPKQLHQRLIAADRFIFTEPSQIGFLADILNSQSTRYKTPADTAGQQKVVSVAFIVTFVIGQFYWSEKAVSSMSCNWSMAAL